jgi:hypothetical protein
MDVRARGDSPGISSAGSRPSKRLTWKFRRKGGGGGRRFAFPDGGEDIPGDVKIANFYEPRWISIIKPIWINIIA